MKGKRQKKSQCLRLRQDVQPVSILRARNTDSQNYYQYSLLSEADSVIRYHNTARERSPAVLRSLITEAACVFFCSIE